MFTGFVAYPKMFISSHLLSESLPAWHLQKLQGPGDSKVLHSIKGLASLGKWMVNQRQMENFPQKWQILKQQNGGKRGFLMNVLEIFGIHVTIYFPGCKW